VGDSRVARSVDTQTFDSPFPFDPAAIDDPWSEAGIC